ncbi:MAG: ACT domain-containing protein, partial [Chlorobia bacterium]|nr:ACT domain-containing protein [Fimbriimonadaceae bacterium]
MSSLAQHIVVFSVLEEKYCVAKLEPGSLMPAFPAGDAMFSITRTDDEISVICEESLAPEGSEVERNWRALKVQGPLEFSLKGVLASMLVPLAEADVSVFAVS